MLSWQMPKIVQKYDKCIGCGSCVAVCPKYWEMSARNVSHNEAGGTEGEKAKLIGGKRNEDGDYELEIEEIGCNKEAIEVCPVNIIKIVTGNQ